MFFQSRQEQTSRRLKEDREEDSQDIVSVFSLPFVEYKASLLGSGDVIQELSGELFMFMSTEENAPVSSMTSQQISEVDHSE